MVYVCEGGRRYCDDIKYAAIARAPLKYLSNIWRALEISLKNYEINLLIT